MLRQFTVLSLILCVLGLSLVGLGILSESQVRQHQAIHELRTALQARRQQLTVLQRPGMTQRMARLVEDLDTLRIRVLETLTSKPWPEAVRTLDYELRLQPETLREGGEESVSILRLELDVRILNALALLSLLDRIHRGVGIWPQEIRGCTINRQAQGALHAQCVLDIFHWHPLPETETSIRFPAGVSRRAV